MSNYIDIGVKIDLERLIKSRVLVQANSGGGKSYLLRKLLEETAGKVQIFVLDVEGEFATLREQHDFMLFGKEGDFQIHIQYAKTICRKLAENKVSAILDLYELKKHERTLFVKRFLEELVELPKHLYGPKLVVIDEAHLFCPEKGSAESANAVIDVCTRGRKRGICTVLATQRLAKLHKDATAEVNEKFIGRTGQDIDMKRAADELGFSSKEDFYSIRNLKEGEFYAFGPAIQGEGVQKIKVSPVKTTHPESGYSNFEIPKPSKKVMGEFDKFKDIPQEAEKELKDKKEMRDEITALRSKITRLENSNGSVDKTELEKLQKEWEDEIQKHNEKCQAILDNAKLKEENYKKAINTVVSILTSTDDDVNEILEYELPKCQIPRKGEKIEFQRVANPNSNKEIINKVKSNITEYSGEADPSPFGKCELKILDFLASNYFKQWKIIQVGMLTGYSHKSGGFSGALANLRKTGLIKGEKGFIQFAGDDYRLFASDSKWGIDKFRGKMNQCERTIFDYLMERSDESFRADDIANATGYSAGSGGFSGALANLNKLDLINRSNGYVSLSEEVKDIL